MSYLKELIRLLNQIDNKKLDDIAEIIIRTRNVYIIGNGGSMSVTIHFAQDLLKFALVKAFTIVNPSIITAYANDEGYENVFYEPLRTLVDKDDLLIIFSSSGSSKNLLKCMLLGCAKVAIIGRQDGLLAKSSSKNLIVGTDNVQIAEDTFGIISHLLTNKVFDLRRTDVPSSYKCS